MRLLVKVCYAPLFFIGFIGFAVWLVKSGGSKALLAALLVLAIALSFAFERIAPFESVWNKPKQDAGRDLAHALVNETLNAISIAAIPLMTAFNLGFDVWPHRWPLWAQLAMTVLVADFGIT